MSCMTNWVTHSEDERYCESCILFIGYKLITNINDQWLLLEYCRGVYSDTQCHAGLKGLGDARDRPVTILLMSAVVGCP